MKYTFRRSRFALLAALVIGLMTSQAQAVNITWNNGGTMGFDPFFHLWDADNNQTNGDGLWSIPGLFAGTQTWQAPDFITRFQITFFNLPSGVGIDLTPPPPAIESTRFVDVTAGDQHWNATLNGARSITFTAPDKFSSLDVGDEFFVNVAFDAPIDVDNMTFTATYSMEPVPEPGTVLLLGTGLLGMVAMVRRKRG